jgi:hypothetical protein
LDHVKWYNHFGKVWQFLNVKLIPTTWSTYPTLRRVHKRKHMPMQRVAWNSSITHRSFMCNNQSQPTCTLIDKLVNNWTLFINKKLCIGDISNNFVKFQRHYGEWNKSDWKEYIHIQF